MDSHYRPRREPNRLPAHGRRHVPSRSQHTDADRQWRQTESRTRQQQRRRPPRRIEDTSLPRQRRKPTLWHRIKEAWKSSGILRVVIGIIATVAIASTINRVVNPPEGLETNEVTAQEAPAIEPSPAVELFIPAIEVHAEFEDGSCRVVNGAINPDSMNQACTYTADDRPYSLPGTTAQDIVVIAGHTGAGVPAVFNNLYDGSANEHKVHMGDKLYVRTANSGQNWLIYTATDLHDPDKQGLSDDASIWGDGPMPGRLLTISCIQPANPLEPAVRNAVVGWQYEGTTHTKAEDT